MTDKLNEELSALADGEVSEFGLRKILLEIDAKPELAHKWSRYHAAKTVFRHESLSSVDLSESITAALVDEPAHGSNAVGDDGWREAAHVADEHKPMTAFLHSWGKPLSSAALAASLTLAVVLSWQEFQPTSEPVSEPLVAAAQQPLLDQSGYSSPSRNPVAAQTVSTQSAGSVGNASRLITQPRVANTSSSLSSQSVASVQRFQVYMISHANHVSVANSAGMMPFARFISAGEK